MIAAGNEHYDEQAGVIRGDSKKPSGIPWAEAARRPGSRQQPHDQSQVVASYVDQVALLHVLPAAQPYPAHAATIKDQGEAALHPFGTQFEGLPGNA